jgi:AcrR family transcriptional regulator
MTKAQRTRVRILDAAAAVFRAQGYTATGLRDVAGAAGLSVSSLYYHFDSREALVAQLLHEGNHRMSQTVESRLRELPPTAGDLGRLRALMSGHVEATVTDRVYVAAALRLLGAVPLEVHEAQIQDARAYGARWRDLLAAAQASGQVRTQFDPHAMRMFVLGGLNSTPDWYHPEREGLTPGQLADEFWLLYVEGLATRRRGTRRASTSIAPAATPGAAPAREESARERILVAAAHAFRQTGFEHTTMNDIAEASGLQRESLYYHFESLEGLARQLLHDAWAHTSGLVQRSVALLPEYATPLARFETALSAHLLSLLGDTGGSAGLVHVLAQLPQDVREHSLTFQRSYQSYLRGLAESAQEAGELRADVHLPSVVHILVSSLNWSVEWFEPTGRLQPAELAAQFLTMVLDGLSPARRNGVVRTSQT